MPNNHTKASHDKQLFLWVLLGALFISLCISWVNFASYVNKLEDSTQGLSYVDYFNSTGQRLAKLELMGTPNDELIFSLDTIMDKLIPDMGKASAYFGDNTEILNGVSNVSTDWELTKTVLEEFRETGDSSALLSASERLFYHTAILTNSAEDYISDLSQTIFRMQFVLIFQIVIIALVIGNRLFATLMEVRRSNALSATMFIDTATGLFNRSKCHEVLASVLGDEKKSRAIIIFDLNDLKKTNDLLGHRVGDELIHGFAQIINKSTKVNHQEVFVGRYGGDEFMAYYNSTDLDSIRLYLSEVAFWVEAFNEKETRYQMSYAAGFAMHSDESEENLSLRQLFDLADQDMYKNKAAMKKRQAEEAQQKLNK